MSSSSPDAVRPFLEVHGARASSVIVHRVPPAKREQFLELERGITQATGEVPGYLGTEIYPPTDPQQFEWVVILHFDRPESLQRWQDSPARAEWIEKFQREIGEFQMKKLPSGFGPWFAGLVEGGGLPSHWKMVLAVLLGLYPIVMLLTIFVSPYTSRFGLAIAMLIGNAVSVALLEWWGMPVLNKILAPWLAAKGERGRTVTVIGLLLILAVLAGMTLLFRRITG